MKIRIGVGAGGATSMAEALPELVMGLDELGFDSLWLSEVLTGPVLDPVVGLSWAAARNPRLKLGTTMLLPGRNVLRLAKQLASLDVLSKGRLLVTLVPGLTYAPEREAIGVDPKQRGAFIDEALPLPERYEIPEATVTAVAGARASGGRVVAVGTSVVRALEGCAARHAGKLAAGRGTTDLVVGPGFVPQVVDGLLTGFHEPGSSHLGLLRAFVPPSLLDAAYSHAEAEGYRGHEFGDSSLILAAA